MSFQDVKLPFLWGNLRDCPEDLLRSGAWPGAKPSNRNLDLTGEDFGGRSWEICPRSAADLRFRCAGRLLVIVFVVLRFVVVKFVFFEW